MYIAIASASRDPEISLPVLHRIAEALQIQVYRDFGPFWQVAGLPMQVFTSVQAIPKDGNAAPLVIFDDADQSGALGWHSVDPVGRAYSRIFWNVIKGHGGSILETANSLSVTMSHEVLEMIGDPYVTWWADMPDGGQESLETCDRVEADAYPIEGVMVSNFVGPRAFRNGDGPYDFMRLLKTPWEIRPGGYAIRKYGTKITNVWSAEYASWKIPLKEHPAARTARRHQDPTAPAPEPTTTGESASDTLPDEAIPVKP